MIEILSHSKYVIAQRSNNKCLLKSRPTPLIIADKKLTKISVVLTHQQRSIMHSKPQCRGDELIDCLDRYVVSTHADGRFLLNLIKGGTVKSDYYNLLVCQNCLDNISFNGFSLSHPHHEKKLFVHGQGIGVPQNENGQASVAVFVDR